MDDKYTYEDPAYSDPSPEFGSAGSDYGSVGSGMQEKDIRQWCMFIHLSQFAGYVIPLGGIIAPIVMWRMKCDEASEIDDHGREAVNATISYGIYFIVSAILCMVIIGIPMLLAMVVVSIVCPIIAAVKASEGKFYTYPLLIRFL